MKSASILTIAAAALLIATPAFAAPKDAKYTKDNVEKLCSRFQNAKRHDACVKNHQGRIGQNVSVADKKHFDDIASGKTKASK